MKVKILNYCEEKIEGRLLALNCNQTLILEEKYALPLIEKGNAEEIKKITGSNNEPVVSNSVCDPVCENKMVNIIYKKRGRPRKEG
jgi:hypothetical protein